DIEVGLALKGDFHLAANIEQTDRELLLVQLLATQKYLADGRQAAQSQRAEHALVDRHLTPTHDAQALISCRGGKGFTGTLLSSLILAKENPAHRVAGRQLLPQL